MARPTAKVLDWWLGPEGVHYLREEMLMDAKLTETDSPEKGVILVWGTEERIIAHADLLRRLFDGVLAPPLDTYRSFRRTDNANVIIQLQHTLADSRGNGRLGRVAIGSG